MAIKNGEQHAFVCKMLLSYNDCIPVDSRDKEHTKRSAHIYQKKCYADTVNKFCFKYLCFIY